MNIINTKKATLIPYLLFSVFCNAQKKYDTIHWRPDYKLTWDDFQGKPAPPKKASVAACNSHLSYTYTFSGGKCVFTVHAIFNRKLSWVIKDRVYDWNLIHEQGHFDLRECYARELSTGLNSLKNINYNTIQQISQKICDSVGIEGSKMQEKYDNETSHGTNDKKQEEWNKKIQLMLRKRGN